MRKFLDNLKKYPTRFITGIIGFRMFFTGLNTLMPWYIASEQSTFSFGLGGELYYDIYSAIFALIGLLTLLSVVFYNERLQKFSLMCVVGMGIYVLTATIVFTGFYPLTWASQAAITCIALVIRLSLGLKEVD